MYKNWYKIHCGKFRWNKNAWIAWVAMNADCWETKYVIQVGVVFLLRPLFIVSNEELHMKLTSIGTITLICHWGVYVYVHVGSLRTIKFHCRNCSTVYVFVVSSFTLKCKKTIRNSNGCLFRSWYGDLKAIQLFCLSLSSHLQYWDQISW